MDSEFSVSADQLDELFGNLWIGRPRDLWEDRFHMRPGDYAFLRHHFANVSGGVYYPGCCRDFAPLFALRDNERFTYQDKGHWSFSPEEGGREIDEEYVYLLRQLEERGCVRDLRVHKPLFRKELHFSFDLMDIESRQLYDHKVLDLYWGEKKGDMGVFVPPGAREAALVYLNGMHLYPSVIPCLQPGTLIRSSTTTDSRGFFDPVPDKAIGTLGLVVINSENGIFRKMA